MSIFLSETLNLTPFLAWDYNHVAVIFGWMQVKPLLTLGEIERSAG